MTRVRHDGGVTGTSNQPTIGSASGIWTLKDAEKFQRSGLWPGYYPPGQSEPYFNYNSLLIHAEGVNGSNNNLIIDSSINNYTITKFGNATQGTFSPFSVTGWSNYFPTTSDYATVASNAGFGFSGTFTIEFWAYFTTSASGAITGVTAAGGIQLYNNAGLLTANLFGTGDIFASTFNIANNLNAWHHIVLARSSSNSMRIWVDGTSYGTGTSSTTFTTAAWAITFSSGPKGYISNLRVTNTDVYGVTNTTLSVPTTSLTAVSGTILLTCQSNRYVDNSTNNLAITLTGTPSVLPTSPFAPSNTYNTSIGGSVMYNVAGLTSTDYATVPYVSNFDFASGVAVSYDAWVYPVNYTNAVLLASRNWSYGSAGPTWGFSIVSANSIQWTINGTGVATYIAVRNTALPSPYSVPLNSWSHIAYTRDTGGVCRIFVNGYLAASGTYANAMSSATGSLYMGVASNLAGTSYGRFYQSNARLFNGYIPSAFQTTNTTVGSLIFSPPTSPVSSDGGNNPVLLVNGVNGNIIDQAEKVNLITANSVVISNSANAVGNSSMYFPGVSYIRAPNSPTLDLSTGAPNFTVECWFNASNTAVGQQSIIAKDWNQSSTNPSYGIFLNGTSGQLLFMIADGTTGSTYIQNAYNGIANNTWYHVALVRNGNQMLSFLNGTLLASNTIIITTKDNGGTFNIGTNNNLGNYFQGYIDEVRITKGLARYTTNFTPTSLPFNDR